MILFLNDTADHDNWGANACSEWLKRILSDAIPETAYTSVMSHWTTDRFYQWPMWLGGRIVKRRPQVIGRFMHPFEFLPAVADDFERIADQWCSGHGGPFASEFLSRLSGSDAVVFNAEGSTYRNNTSSIRCLFALWLASTRFKKYTFFTNGSLTLTPVFPILNAMVQKTFSAVTAASVREPCSLDNARDWIPKVPVALFPDSVFYAAGRIEEHETPEITDLLRSVNNKSYFCMSLSMLTSSIGRYHAGGIRLTGLYDLLIALKQVVPVAVLMARDGMDQSIIRDLARATGSFFFGPHHHYSTLLPLLRSAQFLVSGRYHHLIMAALAGCPVIPLRTTSHKVDGLCRLMHPFFGTAYDPTWLRPELDTVTERARELVACRKTMMESLQTAASDMGRRASGIGTMIREGMGL